jgi:hypothetical protein
MFLALLIKFVIHHVAEQPDEVNIAPLIIAADVVRISLFAVVI